MTKSLWYVINTFSFSIPIHVKSSYHWLLVWAATQTLHFFWFIYDRLYFNYALMPVTPDQLMTLFCSRRSLPVSSISMPALYVGYHTSGSLNRTVLSWYSSTAVCSFRTFIPLLEVSNLAAEQGFSDPWKLPKSRNECKFAMESKQSVQTTLWTR